MDFILGDGEVAIEVKGAARVHDRMLRPIQAFIAEYSPKTAYVVSNEPVERIVDGVRIIPWRRFLESLWDGRVIA